MVLEVWDVMHIVSANCCCACVAISCGSLTYPRNGAVNIGQGTLYKATANFSCDAGLQLKGSEQRICHGVEKTHLVTV